MNISEHITYREATFSITAIRNGIVNIPNELQLRNMQLLAVNLFEPLRTKLGYRPIYISSFFRCEELNAFVGGKTHSQHRCNEGAAMDIDNDNSHIGPYNKEIFDCIKNNFEFDQLIWEYGNNESPDWVHVSYNEGKNRKELLRCVNGNYYKIK